MERFIISVLQTILPQLEISLLVKNIPTIPVL
nr:MAG TPA: hypothetical protein [Caudoviricetes sp.]